MNNFEKITQSMDAAADFLAALPAPEGPWDTAFHRAVCAKCEAKNCEEAICPDPKLRNERRRRVAWWLGLEAE